MTLNNYLITVTDYASDAPFSREMAIQLMQEMSEEDFILLHIEMLHAMEHAKGIRKTILGEKGQK